jgi:hypothetical protein
MTPATLHDTLREKTLAWKSVSWAVDGFPALGETLQWAGKIIDMLGEEVLVTKDI